jgi:hypothetical protein
MACGISSGWEDALERGMAFYRDRGSRVMMEDEDESGSEIDEPM